MTTITEFVSEWIAVEDELPPKDMVVMTKIDDSDGVRNENFLMRKKNLWFNSGCITYVYYEPTHWKPISRDDAKKRTKS